MTGNQQGAPFGQTLPEPLTVGVFTGNGRAVKHARVTWTVTHGNGVVSADTTTVSDSGTSAVGYTVGDTPGTDSVRATLAGTTDAVTFAVVAGERRSPWPGEPAGF